MSHKKGIKLTFAISLLVLSAILSATVIHWYLSINALRSALTDTYLENNYQYAKKVSYTTNDLFYNMQHNLDALAKILSYKEMDQQEFDQWRTANQNYFNSMFTTDANGVVQLTSSPGGQGKIKPGVQITSDLMKQALKNQQSFISDPYLAQSGNLTLIVSSPVFDKAGHYKGVVDGTVYLEKESSLQKMLNIHSFQDETSLFVVDRSGKIVYHPDSSRINESLADHPLIKSLMQGESGAAQITSKNGNEYFSGYAYVENTGWGIVSQTPTSVINKPLRALTIKVIFQSLPLLLIILLAAWIYTARLTKPLNKLARFSEEAILANKPNHALNDSDMKSHIYEVQQLNKHVQNHFKLLNNLVHQDGLTGLANRRAFDADMLELMKHNIPFSLIMCDIDHFKAINDQYGHLLGDDAIREIASIMSALSREEDKCYRYGGEEFAILLKGKNTEDAFALAERLRTKIAEAPSPVGKPLTISLGISAYEERDQLPEEIIERADSALYQSKVEGRNRTTIYGNKHHIHNYLICLYP